MSDPRKQYWYQISLRAGIVIMLLAGILVGTIVSCIREQQAKRLAIEKAEEQRLKLIALEAKEDADAVARLKELAEKGMRKRFDTGGKLERVLERVTLEKVRHAIAEQILNSYPEAKRIVNEAEIWFDKDEKVYHIGPWKADPTTNSVQFVGPNGQETAKYRIVNDQVEFFDIKEIRVMRDP
jgi:hypothetical protein